jgi:hypothetical protein
MNVNSLELMESIVDNNESLSWEGWTVIESNLKKNGMLSADGAFVNGEWIVQKRYEPEADGWTIPNRLVDSNGSQG